MKVIQIPVQGFDNNFTYLVTDKESNTLLIDPTGDSEKIDKEIKKNNAKISLVLITHSHPDHIENLNKYSKDSKVIIPKKGKPGQIEEISFSNIKIKQIHTPGHSEDSVCYLIKENLFTGDTIFCKGIGTTRFGGNKTEQKETLGYLLSINKNLHIWPGHNYGGKTCKLGEALEKIGIKPSKKEIKRILNKKKKYKNNFL